MNTLANVVLDKRKIYANVFSYDTMRFFGIFILYRFGKYLWSLKFLRFALLSRRRLFQPRSFHCYVENSITVDNIKRQLEIGPGNCILGHLTVENHHTPFEPVTL